MDFIAGLIGIVATIGIVMLLPTFYWLLIGQWINVKARVLRANKLAAKRKREKLK